MYLSSYLYSKKQSVKLIDKCVDKKSIKDLRANNQYIKDLFSEISDYNPDIIGMTLFSRELKDIAMLCKLIKQEFKSSYIILGGPHATALPEETLKQIPHCDFIVRGEGEATLYNLVLRLNNNSPLHNVKGISFRTDNKTKIFSCDDAEPISDLDSLPFPDRESLIHNYQNGNYSSFVYGCPSDILITSRGCPFQCNFCFKVCDKYRSRTPENILSEIDWIVNNISPECIQIMDDSFTIHRERTTAILDALINRKYKLKFKVRSRVNAVDEELLRKMKQAGVNTIVYGLESGSQQMLDAFNKKTTVEQNIAACRLTRKVGLTCLGDMILFYPGENRQTLKETERFIKKAKPTAVKFFVLTPLPKTKIYEDARKSGRLVGDWNICGETPWVKLDEFTGPKQMRQIAKKMFIKTLLNPFRIFWLLKSYGKIFISKPFLTLRMIAYNLRKRKENY
jgi:radical SAM superfamily enzyme YgiQ (UPF0313 family)